MANIEIYFHYFTFYIDREYILKSALYIKKSVISQVIILNKNKII